MRCRAIYLMIFANDSRKSYRYCRMCTIWRGRQLAKRYILKWCTRTTHKRRNWIKNRSVTNDLYALEYKTTLEFFYELYFTFSNGCTYVLWLNTSIQSTLLPFTIIILPSVVINLVNVQSFMVSVSIPSKVRLFHPLKWIIWVTTLPIFCVELSRFIFHPIMI